VITHAESNTCVDEVASGVYRICTPVTIIPGGFSFNRYLIVDDTPVLYHTGPRRMFPLTQGAVAAVIPLEELR
jgi:flavorubredoxin